MAESLKVIALISGGKDSFFSMLHCLANGHVIVALANLHPPPGGNEDLNSFMYQTVGSNVIPLYESALGIPLYRQEISGSAVTQDKDYSKHHADETESLVPLLEKIKREHPEANAVSAGAILSSYQRTRVENVALRLGLTPLSFLWQYPFLPPYVQSSLLTDMQSVGQVSKIIKVASGGLDETFLSEDVADPRNVTRMKHALARFSGDSDGALLGEGGEYETLAVDGPSLLWKSKISGSPTAGAMYTQPDGTSHWTNPGAYVDRKQADQIKLQDLRKPPTFDDEFLQILNRPLALGEATMIREQRRTVNVRSYHKHHQVGRAVFLSNIIYCGRVLDKCTCPDVQLQFTNIILRLKQMLSLYHMTLENITHCTLLLRDMNHFAMVNEVYQKAFNYTNPPSRVTIAVGMKMDVMLSVVAHHYQPGERQGLHVQSRSYWAPANIGPYSQAISIPLCLMRSPTDPPEKADEDLKEAGYEVHVAGQIPLEPASMTLYTGNGFKGEVLLSLQHLFRIGRTQNVKWWIAGVAMVPPQADDDEQGRRVCLAQAAWNAIHEMPDPEAEDEDEVVDPWDRRNLSKKFDDRVKRAPLPDYGVLEGHTAPQGLRPPPCFVVEVEALPRFASIEWACTGLTTKHLVQQYTDRNRTVGVDRNATSTKSYACGSPPIRSQFTYRIIEILTAEDETAARLLMHSTFQHGTLYAAGAPWDWDKWASAHISWVPCRRVWGENGEELRGVLVAVEGRWCEGVAGVS